MESYNKTPNNTMNPDNIQEYMDDFSNVLDNRISEFNDQLQQSKKEILDLFKEYLINQNGISINLKDLHYSVFGDESKGIESISKLRKFKVFLDSYLTNVDCYIEIKDKFSKSTLTDIIKIQDNKFKFINYKIGTKLDSFIPVWQSNQCKPNFSFLNDSKTAIYIKYQSCYELYVTDTTFETSNKTVKLEVECISTTNYHAIGLVNESYAYGTSCICLRSSGLFMVDRGGNVFINGVNTTYSLDFYDGQKHLFEFMINLDDPDNKFWVFKFNETEYGPFKLTGIEFKIAVGMCSEGDVIYRFLD